MSQKIPDCVEGLRDEENVTEVGEKEDLSLATRGERGFRFGGIGTLFKQIGWKGSSKKEKKKKARKANGMDQVKWFPKIISCGTERIGEKRDPRWGTAGKSIIESNNETRACLFYQECKSRRQGRSTGRVAANQEGTCSVLKEGRTQRAVKR